jgi:hypothetical protein
MTIAVRLRAVAVAATLVALVALAVGSAPAAAQSNAPVFFGYNDATVRTWFEDSWRPPTGIPNRGLSIWENIAWTLRGGSSTTRLTIDWRHVELNNNSYDWGPAGYHYDGLVAFGVRPIVTVLYAPDWARNDGCIAGPPEWKDCTGPPDDTTAARNELREFTRALVQRMPKAAAVEVWNEPNLGEWFWGKKAPDPARYARLLCSAYQGVKDAQPTMPVLTGGIAGVLGDVGLSMSLRNFLNGIYDGGGGKCFDHVGYHSYTGTESAGNEQAAHATRLQIVRDVLARKRQTNKHIWMTEAGYPGMSQAYPEFGVRDEQGQADALVRTLRYFAGQPKVDAVVVHDLLEFNGTDHLYSYSVLKRLSLEQWTPEPKLAFCALATERRGNCNPVSSNPPPMPPLPACADGRDNDRDGKTDHPDDPGCSSRADLTE